MKQISQIKKGITADHLKWIALISMFIDHIGAVILEKMPEFSTAGRVYSLDTALRLIGRISFPIYCFLLVEGFYHTRSRIKYLGRLFAFAIISELPFELSVFGEIRPGFHNVYWTLLLGMILMIVLEKIKEKYIDKYIGRYTICALAAVAVTAATAHFAGTDYGAVGVLLIFILYRTREERLKQSVLGAVAMSYELTAPIAFVFTYFYNGRRKKNQFKYGFYLFYPIHLLLLYYVRLLIL